MSREILVWPDLTLNRTRITHSAPFSSYAGFERLLVVVSGQVALTIDGDRSLLGPRDLVTFDGDSRVSAEVLESPVEVFNLIADGTRWEISARIVKSETHIAARGGLIVVHVAEGAQALGDMPALVENDTILSHSDLTLSPTTGWSIAAHLLPAAPSHR